MRVSTKQENGNKSLINSVMPIYNGKEKLNEVKRGNDSISKFKSKIIVKVDNMLDNTLNIISTEKNVGESNKICEILSTVNEINNTNKYTISSNVCRIQPDYEQYTNYVYSLNRYLRNREIYCFPIKYNEKK